MGPLKNQVVLITGATSGIGEACARAFASEGAKIILTGRRQERLDKLAAEFRTEYGVETHTLNFDVTDKKAVHVSISNLPDKWLNIDILINNAGMARGIDKVHEADVADWDKMLNTNVHGLLYVTRAVVPGMVERNRGHVINIGSTAGHDVYPRGAVYCATKHAVDAITKGLRIDLVDTEVKVSTVDPGLVETEFSVVRFAGDQQRADNVYKGMTPLTGKDIAETVMFVASRPKHVQIAEIIIMPSDQAAATIVHRR